MKDVHLHFYSERGIVNSIILWIYKQTDKKPICDLLKTIMNKELKPIFNENDFESLDIYDEFSFGDFGSPDLILKIQTKEKRYLFFIEAKVGKYIDSAAENDAKGNINYEGNASKINVQLSLRKRFMELPKAKQYIEEKSNDSDYERKLKKESLIDWVNKHLKDKDYEKYYISLTNDDDKPYSNKQYFPLDYDNSDSYGYWLYNDIKHVLNEECKEYNKAWEYTIGKDTIQIKREKWEDKKADQNLERFNNETCEVILNTTARTIKFKNGNSIFRLWQANEFASYLLEIIDKLAFDTLFNAEYKKEINGYYLIDDLCKIKLKELN